MASTGYEMALGRLTAGIFRGAGGPVPPLNPNAQGLPGSDVLQSLADGIGYWALIAAIVGIVVGAIMWAFGHYSQNYQQAYNGRRGVMVSGVAALLVGAAPKIISFFLGAGTKA